MNQIRDYWLEWAEVSLRSSSEHDVLSDAAVRYVMAPRLQCQDGFTISVQASSGHYCSPRCYLKNGNYAQWEAGYPSEAEELLAPYAESEVLTDTVYGYVPTEVINAVLSKHGGVVGPQSKI